MATATYMAGRKKYQRPQGMLWSDNSGTVVDGALIPNNNEINSVSGVNEEFIILTDDNRSPFNISYERIQNRMRMINGRMRSFYVGDKLKIDVSWQMIPSRSFISSPDFDTTTGFPTLDMDPNVYSQYTTDGGAGGADIVDWYENHPQSFFVFLAYDKFTNFDEQGRYLHMGQYNDVVEMYFSSFTYSVEKRGASTFDFWNISLSLEEV